MHNEMLCERLRKDIEKAMLAEVKEISGKIAELACGDNPFGAVEFSVRNAVLEIGARALEAVVKQFGGGYEGSAARCGCGQLAKFKEYRESYLNTITGSFQVKKAYYYCPECRSGFHPLDKALELEKGRAPGLRRLISFAGVGGSFEEGARSLKEYADITVSSQTVERVTEAEGAKAKEREKAQDKALLGYVWPKEKPERMYVSVDGTTAPMRGSGKREYREFKVGVIYGQDSEAEKKRYYAGLDKGKDFMLELRRQAIEKGLANANDVACLGDGAPWIWIHFEKSFPMAVQILDFWHLMEHVYECADLVFGEGSRKANSWSVKAKKKLKKKGGIALIVQLKRLRQRLKKKGAKEAVDKLVKYLEDNKGRTDYPTYIKHGLHIGSGPVEAACKTLIGQRLKLSGMAWTEKGAEEVAKLRAIYLSSCVWDSYWGFNLDGAGQPAKIHRKAG